MLAGFVDNVAASGAFGSWHSGGLAAQANQYAAMPSLHVAWAAWSGLAVWQTTTPRLVRAVAAVYPLLTVFAVLATANHLLIDSAAGVATVAVAVAVEANLARAWPHVRSRLPVRASAATAGAGRQPGVSTVRREWPGPAEGIEAVRLDGSSGGVPPDRAGSGRTPAHGPGLPQC
jgi:hypothetical protein